MNTDVPTKASPHSSMEAAPSFFRGFLQGKTRIVMAWLFAVLLIFNIHQFPTWPGIVVCFLGASLRFWASGFLRKDSRPAVGGPYAWVRNPLYLGTYLMAVGTTLAVEAWALLALVTILYAVVYHYIILDEETKLARLFGAPYLTYKKLVPRFFPRPWPARAERLLEVNPEPSHQHYSWKLAHKNKAYEAYATFAALIGLVALVAYAWTLLSGGVNLH